MFVKFGVEITFGVGQKKNTLSFWKIRFLGVEEIYGDGDGRLEVSSCWLFKGVGVYPVKYTPIVIAQHQNKSARCLC